MSNPSSTTAAPSRYAALINTVWLLLGVAMGGATLIWGWYTIYSVFRFYDDEGYLMISLQQFLHGKPLYDQVYSQYGPAYYLAQMLTLGALRSEVCHDAIRAITLGHWFLTAGVTAIAVFRLSRSALAALLAYGFVFSRLMVFINEPGHPQSFCVLLLALLVLTATYIRPDKRGQFAGGIIGILVGALALTKINLGVYALCATGLALLVAQAADGSRFWRQMLLAGGAISILLPIVLMHDLFAAGWVKTYCLVAVAGIGAAVAAFAWGGEEENNPPILVVSRRLLFSIGAGGAVIGLALIGFVLARGTTLKALLWDVVLQHARLQNLYAPPYEFGWLGVGGVVVSVLLAAAYLIMRRRGAARIANGILLVGKLSLGGGVLALYLLREPLSVHPAGLYLLPFSWLGAIAPTPEAEDAYSAGRRFGRVVLVSMAVFEGLWAYPVAGPSHVGSALFLTLAIAALCLSDAGKMLLHDFPAVVSPRALRFAPVLAITAALVALSVEWRNTAEAGLLYRSQPALGLPGAARLRLPAPQAQEYQALCAVVTQQPGPFLSCPGFNSLYFWTRREPPTGFNAGLWMTLLSDAEQQAVVDRLAASPQAIILENPELTRFWLGHADISRRPLVTYIATEFQPAGTVGAWVVLERRGKERPTPPAKEKAE